MSNNLYFPTKRQILISSRTSKFSSKTYNAFVASLLEITALFASILCRKGKQAAIPSQEGKQGIKFKAGEIKCYKDKNYPPPTECRKIPLLFAPVVVIFLILIWRQKYFIDIWL